MPSPTCLHSPLHMLRAMILLMVFAMLALSGELIVYAQDATPTAEVSATATGAVITPLQTATSRPDGSLVHVVGFGQKLPEIARAYGVTVEQIQRLNGLPPDSVTLYSGQKLLIIPKAGSVQAATAAPAPTRTLAATPTAELPTPPPAAPAAQPGVNPAMILPLAGGLILLGGALLLIAALVLRKRQ